MPPSGDYSSNGNAPPGPSSRRKITVSLVPFELQAIREAAQREGYGLADYLAVSAYKASGANCVVSPKAASLLTQSRSLVATASSLEGSIAALLPGGARDNLQAQVSALVIQALDVCRLAYLAEEDSREREAALVAA